MPYAVVEDSTIIDSIGTLQELQREAGETEGISLNRLHLALNESGRGRINYYRLKTSLERLTESGLLERKEHQAKRTFYGRNGWPLWTVADWESWSSSRNGA